MSSSKSKPKSALDWHRRGDQIFDEAVEMLKEIDEMLDGVIKKFRAAAWHYKQASVSSGTIDPKEFAKQEKEARKK